MKKTLFHSRQISVGHARNLYEQQSSKINCLHVFVLPHVELELPSTNYILNKH
jgi:hypothetical protein